MAKARKKWQMSMALLGIYFMYVENTYNKRKKILQKMRMLQHVFVIYNKIIRTLENNNNVYINALSKQNVLQF